MATDTAVPSKHKLENPLISPVSEDLNVSMTSTLLASDCGNLFPKNYK
jgi:hypothetical protein